MPKKPSWSCITVLISSHNFNNNGRFHTEDEQIVLMFGRLMFIKNDRFRCGCSDVMRQGMNL